MEDIVDLVRYPLDQPRTTRWSELVAECRRVLDRDGLFNLPGFFEPDAIAQTLAELVPAFASAAFPHSREHNIYFQDHVEGLGPAHPALKRSLTSNRTVAADRISGSPLLGLYEHPGFATFLAAVTGRERLHPMADPLARVNVVAYGEGEALSWHFDRSEFTTTLLLQAPAAGAVFEYAKDLRTDTEPNHEGVARLHAGLEATTLMPLEAGTLNVFRGVNTPHRVSAVEGSTERIVAVFSFFDRPGVVFTDDERLGFYGRTS